MLSEIIAQLSRPVENHYSCNKLEYERTYELEPGTCVRVWRSRLGSAGSKAARSVPFPLGSHVSSDSWLSKSSWESSTKSRHVPLLCEGTHNVQVHLSRLLYMQIWGRLVVSD